MVTLQRSKESEFDNNPEFDIVKKELAKLEQFIHEAPKSHDSYQGGPYLSDKLYSLRNKDTISIKTIDAFDDGNSILPTIFNFTSLFLMMYIDVQLIGIDEGRGKIDMKPLDNGLHIEAHEWDLCKRPHIKEAHAIKRSICREYVVDGMFDWKKFVYTLSPDKTLTIKIPTINIYRSC